MKENKKPRKKLWSWRGYNVVDLLLLASGLVTIVVTSIVFKSQWLIIVNSLLGLLCVFMQAKGKIATQFIGIVWFVFYCFLSYQQKYYGETILYACIMIPLYVYGVIHWLAHRDKTDNTVLVKTKFSKKELAIVTPVFLAVTGGGILSAESAEHRTTLAFDDCVLHDASKRLSAYEAKQVEPTFVSPQRHCPLCAVAVACV